MSPISPRADRRELEDVAQKVFAALADPTRRRIMAELSTHGSATVTELAARMPITRQAVAKHILLLSTARLVSATPGERRRVRYSLETGPMKVAEEFLSVLARDWDTPLNALKTHVERGAGS